MNGSALIYMVREIAHERPDYVYEKDRGEISCKYRDDDQSPRCLIGHALHRLGHLDFIDQLDNEEGIAFLLATNSDEVRSTLRQRDWLHSVQKMQDAERPWGAAVFAADEQQSSGGSNGFWTRTGVTSFWRWADQSGERVTTNPRSTLPQRPSEAHHEQHDLPRIHHRRAPARSPVIDHARWVP